MRSSHIKFRFIRRQTKDGKHQRRFFTAVFRSITGNRFGLNPSGFNKFPQSCLGLADEYLEGLTVHWKIGVSIVEEKAAFLEDAVFFRLFFYLAGKLLSENLRFALQDYKERILALTRKQVLRTAEKYFDPQNRPKAVAVISGEQQLKAANQNLSNRPLELARL